MVASRSTIAVNQDVKKQLEEAQRIFEQRVRVPTGSLSQQVFLECSAQLSLALLEALEKATNATPTEPNAEQVRREADKILQGIRSQTMFRQLAVTQREAKEAADAMKAALAAIGIVGLIVGAAVASAALAPRKKG